MGVLSDLEMRAEINKSVRYPESYGRPMMILILRDSFVKGVFASDRSISGFGSAGGLFPDWGIGGKFVIDPVPEDDQVQEAYLDLRVGDGIFIMPWDFTSLGPENVR